VVFGPDGHNHNISLTKKFRRAALKSALSLRFQQGNLVVLDALTLDGYKTKDFQAILNALGLESALFIDAAAQATVVGSARNLSKVKVLEADGLNVYDILRHPKLVITLPAVTRIQQRFE
jgi:large subunit ribosomal protein L4